MNHNYASIDDPAVERFYRRLEHDQNGPPPVPGLVWAYGMWVTPETRDYIEAEFRRNGDEL